MKVLSISIENFRSIREEVVLPIKKIGQGTCYVLLGINESGKSNILDAIALINNQDELDYELDCHKEAQEEDEAIDITYDLDIGDGTEYKEFLIGKGWDKTLVSKIKFTTVNRGIFLDRGEERQDEYQIWIKEDKGFDKYVLIKDEKGKESIELRTPENEVLHTGNGTDLSNILTKARLETRLEIELFDLLDQHMPKVIFWRPSDERYLINGEVDLNAFKENPDISIPLRNCFRIAGIKTPEKIKAKIEGIAGRASKSLELQQKLSESVTEHINAIWEEHDVSVQFSIDNSKLSFLVKITMTLFQSTAFLNGAMVLDISFPYF